jgi:hypothetical protein
MTDNVETTQGAEAPALGLNDLAAIVQIIDICSKRGAFEGPELETVGQVRGRVAAFIQANAPAQEESEAPAEEASEDDAAE